jgi:O-antigen ligase
MTRFVAGWAALAVVLTSATQLRPAAAPIGPGEFLIAGWLLFVGILLLGGQRVVRGSVFRVLLLYWLMSALLLALGSLVVVSLHKLDWSGWMHDTIALTLQASFTCMLALKLPDRGENGYYLTLARTAFFTCAVSMTLLLVLAQLAESIGPIDPWYVYRFRGWAENPNQIALMVLGMPFLGWYLLRRARGRTPKVFYGLAILGCIWVGLATWSDGLRVAWLGALAVVGFLLWCRALRRSSGPLMYFTHVLVPALALVLALGLGQQLATRLQSIGQEMYEEQEQGETRFINWMNGLRAIGYSPLVGLGPGAHSGFEGPFEGFEAHNTYIDWGTNTGMLGVALQLALLTWAAWRVWRAKAFALLAGFGALLIFSVFAYTLRQPIYWLLLVLTLRLTERQADFGIRQISRSPTESGKYPLRPAWQTPGRTADMCEDAGERSQSRMPFAIQPSGVRTRT